MVIFPEGYAATSFGSGFRTWNTGVCCGAAVENNVDDVSFTRAIIEDLINNQGFSINTNRIYATGHSNGAMFSYRLLCEASDIIRAIAPNAGSPSYFNASDCSRNCTDSDKYGARNDIKCWEDTNSNNDCDFNNFYQDLPQLYSCDKSNYKSNGQIPVLSIWGVLDENVVYYGGAGHDFGSTSKDNGRPNPPEWYIAHWAAMMNSEGDSDVICDEIEYNTMIFEDSSSDSANTTCINITSCDGRNVVVDTIFCSVYDGGHTWPGGEYSAAFCDADSSTGYKPILCAIYAAIVGDIAESYDASVKVVDFFEIETDSGDSGMTSASSTTIEGSTTSESDDTDDDDSAANRMIMFDTCGYVITFSMFLVVLGSCCVDFSV